MAMVLENVVSFRRVGSMASIIVARCAMYRFPTRPDELASPLGWASLAERSSKAAELAAPQDAMTIVAPTRTIWPSRSISTASTRLPEASVRRRRANAPVHSFTVGFPTADRTHNTSASLLACTRHGNELQVLHRT